MKSAVKKSDKPMGLPGTLDQESKDRNEWPFIFYRKVSCESKSKGEIEVGDQKKRQDGHISCCKTRNRHGRGELWAGPQETRPNAVNKENEPKLVSWLRLGTKTATEEREKEGLPNCGFKGQKA